MIRLGLPKEPRWLNLGSGVEVLTRPLSTAIYRAATATAYRKALALAEERGLIEEAGGSITDIPDPTDQDGIVGFRAQFMVQALAVHAIQEWKGVGDETGNQLAPVTAKNVSMFIRDFPLQASRFEEQYLYEIGQLSAEGNGSGAGPNGTSEVAPVTAGAAIPIVAESAPITSMPQ